jgi:catechol 2,3-dioxygenase-like lactoylglutathione lyase family enzyme
MPSPIENRIGTTFIPVSNIEKARDWYCKLLGLPADGEILFGHLYIVPMAPGSSGLVLDSKVFTGPQSSAPLFHFNTQDVHAAYRFLQENGVELVSEIQADHFFTFKDPDGNLLMVCKC